MLLATIGLLACRSKERMAEPENVGEMIELVEGALRCAGAQAAGTTTVERSGPSLVRRSEVSSPSLCPAFEAEVERCLRAEHFTAKRRDPAWPVFTRGLTGDALTVAVEPLGSPTGCRVRVTLTASPW